MRSLAGCWRHDWAIQSKGRSSLRKRLAFPQKAYHKAPRYMLKDKTGHGEDWGHHRDPESIVVWLDAFDVDAEYMKIWSGHLG